MFKDNGEVIHFSNPKVQASLGSNTFAISGHSDTKCKYLSSILCFVVIVAYDSFTRNVTDHHVTNGHVH